MSDQSLITPIGPLLAGEFARLALASKAKQCTSVFYCLVHFFRATDQCTFAVAKDTVEAEVKAATHKYATTAVEKLAITRELRRCLKKPMGRIAEAVALGYSMADVEGFPPFRREDYE